MSQQEYGWIKLNRQLLDHWVWREKIFSDGQAWVDMLLLANSRPGYIRSGDRLLEIPRGSFFRSIRRLSERWGWSAKRVYRFFETLESDGMIRFRGGSLGTLVEIVNYEEFQGEKSPAPCGFCDVCESEEQVTYETENFAFRENDDTQTRRKEEQEYLNKRVDAQNSRFCERSPLCDPLSDENRNEHSCKIGAACKENAPVTEKSRSCCDRNVHGKFSVEEKRCGECQKKVAQQDGFREEFHQNGHVVRTDKDKSVHPGCDEAGCCALFGASRCENLCGEEAPSTWCGCSGGERIAVKREQFSPEEVFVEEIPRQERRVGNPPKKQVKITRKPYGTFKNVRLSDHEVEELRELCGEMCDDRIEKLSSYKQRSGRRYSDDYAAIRCFWLEDRPKIERAKGKKIEFHRAPSYDIVCFESVMDEIFTESF